MIPTTDTKTAPGWLRETNSRAKKRTLVVDCAQSRCGKKRQPIEMEFENM
jgi:hypothetical protein